MSGNKARPHQQLPVDHQARQAQDLLAMAQQPSPEADEGPVPMEFGLVELCQCGALFQPSGLSDLECG